MHDELKDYVGRVVVLDTRSPLLYIGRLEKVESHFLAMADVDVHDMTESASTKEVYILESKKFGVKKNRARASVRVDEVVSLSLLEDVIEF